MKLVSYYAIERTGADNKQSGSVQLLPEDIDADLCTHIILIGAASVVYDDICPVRDSDVEIYKRMVALKERNPNLKIMLCLDSKGLAKLVKDRQAVDTFASNAKQFLIKYGFDGLDIDWEFPGWPSTWSNTHEKSEFSYLIIQLCNSLKLAQEPPLLLSIAVAAPKIIIDCAYEIHVLSQNVDFINLMGYDFHIFWPYLPFTGHNAPLRKRWVERACFATMNIQWAAKYWIKKGAPKDKLVVGIPTYGRTWKLICSFWNGVCAPALSQGMYRGYLSYPQALKFVKDGGKDNFDKEALVPFASHGRDWISYENPRSISEKVKWIKEQGFAGVMAYCLNSDDFTGKESGRRFDLLNVMKEILEEGESE